MSISCCNNVCFSEGQVSGFRYDHCQARVRFQDSTEKLERTQLVTWLFSVESSS